MVKGVASKRTMMSDSDSNMDMNSEISGHSFKSRSSRSGISTSMTSTTECQTLKDVMKRICVAEKAIKHFENQVQNPIPGGPNDGYKSLLKNEETRKGNFGKRASKFTSMYRPRLTRSFLCPGRIY
ncbi:hypothetical protein TNIN_294121 [Trichonephila inaurata madagascariensis]|uniref:Uncharacterized protein n=1 Tax=Trichonephila inaurata madagascariensis TaxID=2747483 RepID=A0A8X7CDC6_9ARAC|nr:hypothetical protein TNIN_294121 [Trichonephila inaurata madagascariensis]